MAEASGSSESSRTLDVNDLESNSSNTEVIFNQTESDKQVSDHRVPVPATQRFAARVQRIRKYINQESERLLADQRRIDVNSSIRREIEAFKGNPTCRIRQRLYHLGLL